MSDADAPEPDAAAAPKSAAAADAPPSPSREKKKNAKVADECAAAPRPCCRPAACSASRPRRPRDCLAAAAASARARSRGLKHGRRSGTKQRKSSRKKVRCYEGHSCKADPQTHNVCDVCKCKGTYARCSGGCDFDICASCFAAKGGVVSKQIKEAKSKEDVVENPFMGWEGWPPMSVVIVTLVIGVIFEIVFCIGFWEFWCGPASPAHIFCARGPGSLARTAAESS